MLRSIITTVLLCLCFTVQAKGEHHRTSKAPGGHTRIAAIKPYNGNYKTTGFEVGDTVPEIIFYTQDDKAVTLHELLSQHVPVLLVSGSYTCPLFRRHAPDVNEIAAFYKGKLDVYVIYTLEAHPDNAVCPYMDTNYTGMQNLTDDIMFPQHANYKDRKAMAGTAKTKLELKVPVLIDGPDNKWWLTYGPAPNNAYLIDTSGIVKGNNHQLNGTGENIWCYIDAYLGTDSKMCQ